MGVGRLLGQTMQNAGASPACIRCREAQKDYRTSFGWRWVCRWMAVLS